MNARQAKASSAAKSVLPLSLPPRGINREGAAAYIGVSPSRFDDLVRDGRMPGPKIVDRRRIWDVRALDLAFSALPEDDAAEDNPWDCVA